MQENIVGEHNDWPTENDLNLPKKNSKTIQWRNSRNYNVTETEVTKTLLQVLGLYVLPIFKYLSKYFAQINWAQ